MTKQTLIIETLRESKIAKGLLEKLEALAPNESLELGGKKYTKIDTDSCEVEYSDDWKAYDFSDKNVIGSFQIQKEVTANDIESVIVGAFEGGSTYWLGLNNSTEIWGNRPKGIPLSTWATQMLLEGKTLDFYDIEDKEEQWTLTLEQLINGFKLNAEKRPFDCDLDKGDATTSNCILQYGIFGKLVYG